MATSELASLVSRLEAAVAKLENQAGGASQEDFAQFVEDYDAFVTEYFDPYLNASAAIGGEVDKQAKVMKSVCDEQRKFLVVVSKHSEPKDMKVFQQLVSSMSEKMGTVAGMKDKLDRKSNLTNHVRAASEGASMFGWVVIPKTPMKYVQDAKDTVMFYSNKVLKDFKNSDDSQKHKTWVASFIKIFDGLRDYIKEHHTTGPNWNKNASPATPDALKGTAPPAGGAPPPPPPPPAGAPAPAPVASKAPSASAVTDLMKDISKGTDVTKGLKKVTNDMKTHKNPELRKHHVPVPYKPTAPAYKPMGQTQAKKTPAKPPKLVLEGKKWVVENHQDNKELKLDKCEMKHTIYIYKCNGCTITVSNKVNSIVLDTCKKTGLVFGSVVSGVEVINCQSVQLQSQGTMHNVSIDKTDGCIVYLNKECLGANIVTAKSSEMNVSIPKDDGDFEEYPIVEQFRTSWDAEKKALVTVSSEQLG